jgi:hypothetical protein
VVSGEYGRIHGTISQEGAHVLLYHKTFDANAVYYNGACFSSAHTSSEELLVAVTCVLQACL